MFDIGWPELMLVMVVALIVIGPKDLPAAIRTVTMVLRKVRGMAAEVQSGLNDIAREAGVDEIKKNIDDVVSYDPEEALKSIGALDDGEFDLDENDKSTADNSILDPAAQTAALADDPDIAAAEAEDEALRSAADDGEAPAPATEAANEDEPETRPATPAASTS